MKPVIRVTYQLCKGHYVVKYRLHTTLWGYVLKYKFLLNQVHNREPPGSGLYQLYGTFSRFMSLILLLFSLTWPSCSGEVQVLSKSRFDTNAVAFWNPWNYAKRYTLLIIQLQAIHLWWQRYFLKLPNHSQGEHFNSYNSSWKFLYTLTFENVWFICIFNI